MPHLSHRVSRKQVSSSVMFYFSVYQKLVYTPYKSEMKRSSSSLRSFYISVLLVILLYLGLIFFFLLLCLYCCFSSLHMYSHPYIPFIVLLLRRILLLSLYSKYSYHQLYSPPSTFVFFTLFRVFLSLCLFCSYFPSHSRAITFIPPFLLLSINIFIFLLF